MNGKPATVPATLTIADAAARTWDAVVVGAGPAGALAAREVARRGLAVLLVDKAAFPRFKVCGCCLNARTLATLAHVGLGEVVSGSGASPLRSVCLAAGGRRARLPLPGGVALSREAFDPGLVAAAVAAGAAFLPQTLAALGPPGDTARNVHLHHADAGVESAARVVIWATGLGGPGARLEGTVAPGSRVGLGAVAADGPDAYEPGTIFMACGRHGYLGLVRLEDGRLDLAAAVDPAFLRRCGGPSPTAAALLAEAGLPPVPGIHDLDWRGTPALTRRAARLAGRRLFVLGDAAGYVEPFTGEGIAWAVEGAAALAPLAARAAVTARWDDDLARRWSGLYRRSIARHQRACRAVAAVLRRPAAMCRITALLAYVPRLAEPLVRYLNRPPPSHTPSHRGSHHELEHPGDRDGATGPRPQSGAGGGNGRAPLPARRGASPAAGHAVPAIGH
jgi:flavin-dependent dehydrogenase